MGVGSSLGVADGAVVGDGSLASVEVTVNVGGNVVAVSVGRSDVGVFSGGSVTSRDSVGVFRALARTLKAESGMHPDNNNAIEIKNIYNWNNRGLGFIVCTLLQRSNGYQIRLTNYIGIPSCRQLYK